MSATTYPGHAEDRAAESRAAQPVRVTVPGECAACEGWGYAPSWGPTCTACLGSGICPDCLGAGEHEADDHSSIYGVRVTPCPTCNSE